MQFYLAYCVLLTANWYELAFKRLQNMSGLKHRLLTSSYVPKIQRLSVRSLINKPASQNALVCNYTASFQAQIWYSETRRVDLHDDIVEEI